MSGIGALFRAIYAILVLLGIAIALLIGGPGLFSSTPQIVAVHLAVAAVFLWLSFLAWQIGRLTAALTADTSNEPARTNVKRQMMTLLLAGISLATVLLAILVAVLTRLLEGHTAFG